MTVEEFSQTRFGAGMQVKINKTGEIRDIISVDFETNKIGVAYNDGEFYASLDDLNWFHCEWVELVPQKHIVHCPDLTGKCFICGEQAFVLEKE